MKIDDLQEYFDLFIIKYLPYKDKEIYQRIIQFLLNYYLKHSYSDIPAEFKSLFEERLITSEVYDSLLLSNGFPDYIIAKLGLKQKEILLQTFMDFNRYKGTLESIRLISNNFDSFNIYELFVDFRSNKWVFVPNIVYKNPKINDRVSGTFLDYDTVVNQTKNFLISEDTLTTLKDNNNILLPIKSNLILIDYNTFIDYQSINQLYGAIILNHFQDHRINLYFRDGIYQTSFKKFYFLWHYIFYNFYHNVGSDDNIFTNLTGNFIVYDYSKEKFPFKLSDLIGIDGKKGIHINYLNLKRSPEALYTFRKEYFEIFQDFLAEVQITEDEIEIYAQQLLPTDLYDYINNRLYFKNKLELDGILDELYNSVITWKYAIRNELISYLTIRNKAPHDIIVDKYLKFIENFISNLPILNIKIQNSITYLLLHHFKPYHTELIFNENPIIMRVKDLFNSVFNDEIQRYTYSGERLTLAHPSYNYSFEYLSNEHLSPLSIISDNFVYDIKVNKYDKLNCNYDFVFEIINYNHTLAHTSYNYINYINYNLIEDCNISHDYNLIYIPPSN